MPIPDKFHHDLQKLIQQANPQSQAELKAFLNSLIGKPLPSASNQPKTDAEKAQELVWEAEELPIDKGRRRAKKALKLDPNCIAAHEYLGGTYSYYYKAGRHYEAGVKIGRRIFGGAFLKANKGHFWGISETRPFMRCLRAMAECLYHPGQTPAAIEIWKEMLELNPNDNQGVRYNLLNALLEQKDLKSYDKYRKQYEEDTSVTLFYSNALKAFIAEGETKKSNRLLKIAKAKNEYVIPLLLEPYPPEEMPESYTFGSREEAILYLHMAWRAWHWTPSAKDWLRKMS